MGSLVIVDEFVCGVSRAPKGTLQLIFEEVLYESEDESLRLMGNKHIFILQPDSADQLINQMKQARQDIATPPEKKLEVARDLREVRPDGETDSQGDAS